MKNFKRIISLLLACVILLSVSACGFKTVEKSELGLSFVLPEDFVRRELLPDIDHSNYERFADIEYGNGEIFFFADVMPYSELGLTSSASITQCTEALLDNMEYSGTNLVYDQERKTATYDTWATEDGTESYYSYITILLGKNNVYIARYACPGTDKEMEKYSKRFAEMSLMLTAK